MLSALSYIDTVTQFTQKCTSIEAILCIMQEDS